MGWPEIMASSPRRAENAGYDPAERLSVNPRPATPDISNVSRAHQQS
jgi:hypothetical protein